MFATCLEICMAKNGQRRRRSTAMAAIPLLLSAFAVGMVASPAAALPAGSGVEEQAREAASRFLSRYVASNGRVVRHDQGGDTVSEGQAYALLLAAAVGDEARFELVWTWTRTHLQRPDVLLSWSWGNGRVLDGNAATDAGLDAAHALLIAADRFGRADYRIEAFAIAQAVLAEATVEVAGGETILVAGSWARTTPYVVNPSYFATRAFAEFAAVTGNRRWAEVTSRASGSPGSSSPAPARSRPIGRRWTSQGPCAPSPHPKIASVRPGMGSTQPGSLFASRPTAPPAAGSW
jgi:hypothetical protein